MKDFSQGKMGTQLLSIYDSTGTKLINNLTISLAEAKKGIVLRWPARPNLTYSVSVVNVGSGKRIMLEDIPRDQIGNTILLLNSSGFLKISIILSSGGIAGTVATGSILVQEENKFPVSFDIRIKDYLGRPILDPISLEVLNQGLEIIWERSPGKVYSVIISQAGKTIFRKDSIPANSPSPFKTPKLSVKPSSRLFPIIIFVFDGDLSLKRYGATVVFSIPAAAGASIPAAAGASIPAAAGASIPAAAGASIPAAAGAVIFLSNSRGMPYSLSGGSPLISSYDIITGFMISGDVVDGEVYTVKLGPYDRGGNMVNVVTSMEARNRVIQVNFSNYIPHSITPQRTSVSIYKGNIPTDMINSSTPLRQIPIIIQPEPISSTQPTLIQKSIPLPQPAPESLAELETESESLPGSLEANFPDLIHIVFGDNLVSQDSRVPVSILRDSATIDAVAPDSTNFYTLVIGLWYKERYEKVYYMVVNISNSFDTENSERIIFDWNPPMIENAIIPIRATLYLQGEIVPRNFLQQRLGPPDLSLLEKNLIKPVATLDFVVEG